MHDLGARLTAIHAQLELLDRCDAERSVFGADTHGYRLGPPLSEAEVAAFEAHHRVALPADYRAFVTTLGNGGAGPFYGLAPLRAEALVQQDDLGGAVPPRLDRPFPLTEPWHQRDPLELAPGTSLHDGVLRLSSHGCGYFDVLVVSGPRRGEVWADFGATDNGLIPYYPSFLAAYEAWLARAWVEWGAGLGPGLLDEELVDDAALAELEPRLAAAVASLDQPPEDPALRDYPRDPGQLLAALAYLRGRAGQLDEALGLFDRVALVSTRDGEAQRWIGRADLYLRAGALEQALVAVDTGLAGEQLWFASEVELLGLRRRALRGLGRREDAVAVSRQLAQLDDDDLLVKEDLAYDLLELGEVEAAAEVFRDAAQRGVGCDPDATPEQRLAQVCAGLFTLLGEDDRGAWIVALRSALGLPPDA